MINFLINRPVSVLMTFTALIMLGIAAISRIPVTPLPDIDIPEIAVHVSQDNSSAEELENTTIQPLTSQLNQVQQLKDIHSETRDGYSLIRLRFNYGTDINYAFIEVNEKVDLSMKSMPKDIERPRVIKASATDIPVFYINVSLKGQDDATEKTARFLELSNFAEQVIKRRLEQLPEIAFADITGLYSSGIYIEPDKASVSALGMNDDDFRQIIENNKHLYGNVSAMDGVLRYNIRFAAANPAFVEDIRNIRFMRNGRVFQLKDIARITVRSAEPKGLFLADNKEAISIAVIKQPETRLEDLRTRVNGVLASLENEYPGIGFQQARDQTELLEFSISNLKQDLLAGSLLAFFLLFFFLKNLRSPILIGITIPVSLVLSILFFWLLHITINIISLSGLVLGVGLMIDNSIIVIDNITQYRQRNTGLSDACVRGTAEIIRPLLSSALTTCSVFLPLIFLSGISGALFYDQAMAITIGLSVSLIVSITLLPTMYYLFHKRKVSRAEISFFDKFGITFFERAYNSGFSWVFSNKRLSFGIVAVLIAANVFLFMHLKREKLPAFEQSEATADIDWNRNINVEENKRRIIELIKALNKRLLQSGATIGEQQYLLNKEKQLSASEARIYFKARNAADLQLLKAEAWSYLRHRYPTASVEIYPPPNIFERLFEEDEPELVARISQSEGDGLPSSGAITRISAAVSKNLPNIRINPVARQRKLLINADQDKLMLYGVSEDAVAAGIRSYLNATEIAGLSNGHDRTPVMIENRSDNLENALHSIMVNNNKGVPVPVSGFLTVRPENTWKTIEGSGNGNFVPLRIETDKPGRVIEKLRDEIKKDPDLDVSFTGSYFSNRELVKEMSVVLMVSVLLLYFILAAQFESLVQPLIVLAELPISMCGALIMLFIFNASLNLISMIGLIVICGIVINDSILKIDTINHLRRNEGYSLIDAIHTGGIRRLQSIVMTALTTILSVVPFLFGTDMGSVLQRPLSLTLIGGMLIGTPVSLYFIPLIYWFYYRKSDRLAMTGRAVNAMENEVISFDVR